MKFSSFGLSATILKGIDAAGYTTPTEIQAKAIPLILLGSDLIGCSETGSGKTAAFVLPVLDALATKPRTTAKARVRVLILTPTRELALQVEESVREYGKFTNIRSVTLYGGVDIKAQLNALRQNVDIIVATPGRLLDHIERGSVRLSDVETLIIDEADRMFDMGFINDVKRIISCIPKERQTLLFSATMSDEIQQLTRSIQREPKRIDVGERSNPVETVEHTIFHIRQDLKLGLLMHMLETGDMDSVLVFSRTKHGADKIVQRLGRSGHRAIAIHSNRSQAQRQRALSGFKRGEFNVLVATDIAARGIDVEGISHVINYDTPAYAEDYIHRIGRTGRAGATGEAFTFVSDLEEDHLKKIERFIGRRLQKASYPGFDASFEPVGKPVHVPMPKTRDDARRERRKMKNMMTNLRRRTKARA
jgi:ATP-dependent RNA helicase RhlE